MLDLVVLVTRGFLVFPGMGGLQDQVGRMQGLVVVWCGVVNEKKKKNEIENMKMKRRKKLSANR